MLRVVLNSTHSLTDSLLWAYISLVYISLSVRYLEFILDVNQPTSVESSRWNIWNMYRVIPDGDVVLVCRTFLQPRKLLPFLLLPLVRLVINHLERYHQWIHDIFMRSFLQQVALRIAPSMCVCLVVYMQKLDVKIVRSRVNRGPVVSSKVVKRQRHKVIITIRQNARHN